MSNIYSIEPISKMICSGGFKIFTKPSLLVKGTLVKRSLLRVRRVRSQGYSTQIDINKLSRSDISKLRAMKLQQERSFKNKTMTYYVSSIAIIFLGLAYAAVPLYRAICARTGFGGIPITDRRKFTSDKLVPVNVDKRIRVSFTSEVSQILPWKFTPEQREVYVVPGETALAFYKARNKSDKDIIGMATYSISPGEAAQYFNKIQCFCFEEQKLSAGEEIDMPVFFFIDPDFASDPAMRNIDDIILHYTFFRAHYGDGSAVTDAMLKGEAISREETEAMLANAALLAPPEVIDTRQN
ncbi:hypothetical protein KAFR_0H02610 [Kazachstania africana CBS 2517]|uniref:Cytochrome c oxidase assembly protein CtaG/Cox11 n=1 Tax=Kazachstania africana (strain ATCC 22294 / BCRC 22015 / CBS 2517 / CECT 1963 / NBRC 1671 / NRRL Y-8276) TaxID=1071382 RepID=H2AZB4_KAZAF|nr:hypothetical protein KAFR_0H02610 [Kazachstania africana CBS 2517]CCF59670.1 hypothetical protein KAFR_0H02610 [Kazachstania africana CBS 2517]